MKVTKLCAKKTARFKPPVQRSNIAVTGLRPHLSANDPRVKVATVTPAKNIVEDRSLL